MISDLFTRSSHVISHLQLDAHLVVLRNMENTLCACELTA